MIHFEAHSGIYTLRTEQTLNMPIDEAWTFFSSPKNLETITPNQVQFEITSQVDKTAYPGQIITYKIGLLPGIKSAWVTEITQVKAQEFFVDEQRFGPYKMWHHEHWFEKTADGKTLMKDKVSYKIPLGILGRIANTLFVKKQLQSIFQYRYDTLDELFNKSKIER